MNREKGFTLIELMIVVAIIGILATVAIPNFIDYLAKSQVSEGVTLISGMKAPINDYYANNGTVPSVAQLGSTKEGKYVSNITILTSSTNIIVRATFSATGASPRIQGKTISIATQDRGISWSCGRASALSSSETTVDMSYLPLGCNR